MNAERHWLIFSSFALSLALFAFFSAAPALGYPLKWPDAIGLLQITLPVFVGYLATASVWAFSGIRPLNPPIVQIDPIRKMLIRGPVVLVALMVITVLSVFGYSHRDAAPDGAGMSVAQLTTFITTALGILTVTTGIAIVALFPQQQNKPPAKQ